MADLHDLADRLDPYTEVTASVGVERLRDLRAAARHLRAYQQLLDAIEDDPDRLREWATVTTPYGRKLMLRIADAIEETP